MKKKNNTTKRITAPRLTKKGGRQSKILLKPRLPKSERAPKIIELKDSADDAVMPTIVPRDTDAVEYAEVERAPYDGNTAFNLYLREVGQTKLLTIQEEDRTGRADQER